MPPKSWKKKVPSSGRWSFELSFGPRRMGENGRISRSSNGDSGVGDGGEKQETDRANLQEENEDSSKQVRSTNHGSPGSGREEGQIEELVEGQGEGWIEGQEERQAEGQTEGKTERQAGEEEKDPTEEHNTQSQSNELITSSKNLQTQSEQSIPDPASLGDGNNTSLIPDKPAAEKDLPKPISIRPERTLCHDVASKYLSWEFHDEDFCAPGENLGRNGDQRDPGELEELEEEAAVRAVLKRREGKLWAALQGIETNDEVTGGCSK